MTEGVVLLGTREKKLRFSSAYQFLKDRINVMLLKKIIGETLRGNIATWCWSKHETQGFKTTGHVMVGGDNDVPCLLLRSGGFAAHGSLICNCLGFSFIAKDVGKLLAQLARISLVGYACLLYFPEVANKILRGHSHRKSMQAETGQQAVYCVMEKRCSFNSHCFFLLFFYYKK